MNYESGNVYIYLTFRTPIDVNTKTGLYDFSQVGEDSPFGGIYRIVQCDNTFNDGNWKQKLKCIRMPGPQGPETIKAINPETGEEYDKLASNKASLASNKASAPAVEIGPEEPPKTSPIDNSSSNSSVTRTAVADNGAASNSANTTDSLRNSSRRAAKAAADNKATTTTSTQAPRVVGFRYYRDLGQK
jgi:hypothetical protein